MCSTCKCIFKTDKVIFMMIHNFYLTTIDFIFEFISSIVDTDEIKRLGKRFRKLDLDNSGALSIDGTIFQKFFKN